MNVDTWHAFDERGQCVGEIDAVVVAQLADHFAHVRQQKFRDTLRLLDMIERRAVRQMTRHFQIET